MTTPADNPDAQDDEPTVGFSFQTPFGFFTHADDLPPQVRSFLANLVEDASLPAPIREALTQALASADTDEDAHEAEASGPHGPGCRCGEEHRDRVWRILDVAFPHDPHLWQAMEALFDLSAQNPVKLDDDERQAALETAVLHLERHAALTTTAQSPADQLVDRFRRQMGGL